MTLDAADKPLPLAKAAPYIGRSPGTLRRAYRDPVRRDYLLLERLLRKVGGRYETTPRLIAQWRHALEARRREVTTR